MINVAEILKYCPKGMKLYSPICGDCTLKCVSLDEEYPIEVVPCSNNDIQLFTVEGKFLTGQAGDECLLFPSKDQRNWNKFKIPGKRGDIMMFKDKSAVFIIKEYTNDFTETFIEFSDTNGTRINTRILLEYIPASEDMKEKLFKAIDNNGYKWDGKNLVKKEYQFKSFDTVLVRDKDDDLWEPDIFVLYDPTFHLNYKCFRGRWKQCIPYDGTRVGTKE